MDFNNLKYLAATCVNIACWDNVVYSIFGKFEREPAKTTAVGNPRGDFDAIRIFDLRNCKARSRSGLHCKKFVKT